MNGGKKPNSMVTVQSSMKHCYTQANEGIGMLKILLCVSVPSWLSIVPSAEVCDATGAS